MPTARLTQVIDCPVAEVFDAVIHIERLPEWVPMSHKSARRLTPGEIAVGAEFEIKRKGFGKVHHTLAEFERNRQVKIVLEVGMLSAGHRCTFTAEGPTRTRIDHELEMNPRGILRLMTPLIVRRARKSMREVTAALKAHLESRGAQSAVARWPRTGTSPLYGASPIWPFGQ